MSTAFKRHDRVRIEWFDHELNGHTGKIDYFDETDELWWLYLDNNFKDCYYVCVEEEYLTKITDNITCTCDLSLLMIKGCGCGAFQQEMSLNN